MSVSIMAILGLNHGPFQAGLSNATSLAKRAGVQIQGALQETGIGHGLKHALLQFGTFGAIEETIRRTVELGESVYDTSRRLGISTDAVQAWDYALKLNGSSIQAASGFFEKLATSRQKALLGNAEMVEGYKRLGVTVNDLKTLRIEDIALKVASTFENGDPQKLIADLRAVGGRGAGEMAAAFRAGLPELIASAKEAGVVISEEVINQLKESADQAKTIWMEFLSGIAPAVAGLGKLLAHAWHDANVVVNGIVGFISGGGLLGGGIQGAKDLMHEYDEESKRKEKEAEERRKKSGGPLSGGADAMEKASAATKHAKEILKLQDQLSKLQDSNDLKRMSTEEEINSLWARRMMILGLMKEIHDPKKLLEAGIDVEEIDKELKPLMEKAHGGPDKKKAEHQAKGDLNSLQKIGGMFVSGGQDRALEFHRQTAHNTRQLVEHSKGKHVTGWQHAHH